MIQYLSIIFLPAIGPVACSQSAPAELQKRQHTFNFICNFGRRATRAKRPGGTRPVMHYLVGSDSDLTPKFWTRKPVGAG